jgi:uroporphyrinogen-III decarboxylase
MAGFVRGTTNLMMDLVENPEGAHQLIDLCTRVVIDWLKAQHEAIGDTVESILSSTTSLGSWASATTWSSRTRT